MSMGTWWSFTKALVGTEYDEPGVYELGDASHEVIYIGSSSVVRTRLTEHLSGHEGSCTQSASYYRVDYTSSYRSEERRRYDAYVRANGRQPKCNDKRP